MGFLDFLLGRRSRGTAPTPVVELPPPAEVAYVVLDVETTGLSPDAHRIVQIALVRVDAAGRVVDEFCTLVNPEGPVGATHIHGIRDVDVAGAPVFRDLAAAIVERIAGLPVVAHNARFDLAFLRAELSGAGWDVPWMAAYCTLQASRRHLPDLARRRLVDCSWAVGYTLDDAHSALADARAAAAILRAFVRSTAGREVELSRARDEARAAVWSDRPARRPRRRVAGEAPPDRAAPAPRRFTPPRVAQPALLARLSTLSLRDVLDEGAPEGSLAYLELLCEALEDGVLEESEVGALGELRDLYELSTDDVAKTHRALLLAMAHSAVDDGHVTREESAELLALAPMLGAEGRDVRRVLDAAETARSSRLGEALGPLPAGWGHGEPLRVGDRVVVTGCDETWRVAAEAAAELRGIRIMSSVSGRTALLVTDGVYDSGKRRRAAELGTRTVSPDVFDALLRHLQPAASVPPLGVAPAVVATVVAATAMTAATAAAASPTAASPSAIRAWALTQGLPVGVRGRLSTEVVAAYAAALSAS